MDPSPSVILHDERSETQAPSNSSYFFSRTPCPNYIENILIQIDYFMLAFKKFDETPAHQRRREFFAKFFMLLTMLTTMSWIVTSLDSSFVTNLFLKSWNDEICTITGWASVFTSMAYYYYNTGPNGVSIDAACMTFRLSAEESLRYNLLLQSLEELSSRLSNLETDSKERTLLLHNLTYLTQKLSDRKKTTISYAIEAFETIKLVAQNAAEFLAQQSPGPSLVYSHHYTAEKIPETNVTRSRSSFNERLPALTHS